MAPQEANQYGIDGSGEYAANKAAVLCFLCDYVIDSIDGGQGPAKLSKSDRLVSFKGFIEDLQFKLNIEYEEGGSNFSPSQKYPQRAINLDTIQHLMLLLIQ